MEARFGHAFPNVRVHAESPPPVRTAVEVGRADAPEEREADSVAERVVSAPPAAPPTGTPDFSRVRIHTDARAAESARSLGALAYTVGDHVVFGAGRFAPGTPAGGRLLAHELAHVAQGGAAPVLRRQVSPELEKIEGLLSYGIFDWAITDAEAVEALALLKQLPRFQQAKFFATRKYADRLRDNLPEDRLPELDALEQGVAEIRPGAGVVEDIRSKLSYGLFDWAVTDKEAVEVLEKLKTLPPGQLAVVLDSINYGRLLDNLPDSRKQELIDLLARGLGTGGAKETEQKTNPGVVLNSLTFTSDHGVLRNNTKDWEDGPPYGKPEWGRSGDDVFSHPISQTRDTPVSLDASINVQPVDAPPGPVQLRGRSDVPFLNFDFSGTMSGGRGQTVGLTSTGKLPSSVMAVKDKYISWTMKWRDWEHEIARSGPHTIFVTVAPPINATVAYQQPTYKRMDKAVEIVADAGVVDPHPLVKKIMFFWDHYNLFVRYSNPWSLADNIALGAQCIDIVRFVRGVIHMVGVPGTADAVVVWARPEAPDVGVEGPYGGFVGMPTVPPEPVHRWTAALIDGDGCFNNFEAALKFNDGSTTLYYPGGVRSVLASADEVLRVFTCLAWLTVTGPGQYDIHQIIRSYRPGCHTGEVTCRH
jgi:hypothetical protein